MELSSVATEKPSRWYRNPDLVFPLLLVLLGTLFFADLLFTSKNFYFRDVTNFHYPLRKVMIDSWARGELPLWNPHVYLGQPMLANPNYMALYPTNLLNLFLPFSYAFKLHLILHVILAGIGAYFLQRRIGIAPVASFAGSLIYQFSGPVLSFLNLFSITQTIAILPWVGWAFLGCLHRFRSMRVIAFGALLSLQMITMEPLMLQCVAWLIGAIVVIHILESPEKLAAAKTVLKTVVFGGIFAAGLSAVQLLPSLELLQLSSRKGGYASAVLGYWSLHPADLINTLTPNLFGSPYSLTGELYWGEKFHYNREGYFISLYLGATTFLLALFSFFSTRKKGQRVFLGLTAITTMLAMGQFGYLYPWLCKWLAVMRFGRYPVKYMLLMSLAISTMAALGLEAVLKRQSAFHRRRLAFVAFVLFGFLLGGLLWCFSVYLSTHGSVVESVLRSWISPERLQHKDLKGITVQLVQSFRWAGSFSLIALLLIVAARFWKKTTLLAGLLVFAVISELLAQNMRLSPLVSGADFEYVSELDQYLKPSPDAEIHRVYHVEPVGFLPVKKIWAPNRSVAWLYLFIRRTGEPLFGIMSGVQYSISRSIDDLNTRESNEILAKGYNLSSDNYLKLLAKLNSTILLTLGEIDSSMVTLRKSFFTGSEGLIRVYSLTDASPRAYFAADVLWATSHDSALEHLLDPKFSYQDSVILEGEGVSSGKKSAPGKARILRYGHNEVLCEVESAADGYLVLLDSYYPGWRATLDGASVPILRANYAFRAIKVQSGRHLVEFKYRPLSFYLGGMVTGLTLVVGAFVLAIGRRRS